MTHQQYSFKDVVKVIQQGRNSLEKIKQMAQEQPSVVHLMGCGGDPLVCIRHGWSVLHEAAKEGATDICEYFITWGADSELEDELSLTPLAVAIWAEHVAIVRLFLKHGANPNRKDKMFGQTSLHWAVHHDKTGEILRLLLEAGATKSINAKDKDGKTALHYASTGDKDYRKNNAKILMEFGADPQITDEEGKRAVDNSAEVRELWNRMAA